MVCRGLLLVRRRPDKDQQGCCFYWLERERPDRREKGCCSSSSWKAKLFPPPPPYLKRKFQGSKDGDDTNKPSTFPLTWLFFSFFSLSHCCLKLREVWFSWKTSMKLGLGAPLYLAAFDQSIQTAFRLSTRKKTQLKQSSGGCVFWKQGWRISLPFFVPFPFLRGDLSDLEE